MKKRLILIINFILIYVLYGFSQYNIKDTCISINLVYANVSLYVPSGAIAKVFGPHTMIGPGYLHKTKSNFLFGIELDYIFGGKVKNEKDIFSNIATSDNNIISSEGSYVNYQLYQQGYKEIVKVGKLFDFYSPNPNSGVYFLLGCGLIQQRIFIEARDNNAPQISNNYAKGYDNLRNGIALNQEIGYLFLSNKRTINFIAALDFIQSWNKSMRPYDFKNKRYYSGVLFDAYFGIKLAWTFPIYKRTPNSYYFY